MVDLTPRPVEDAPGDGSPRRYLTMAVLALVVLGGGFVVWQGLSNATLYFYDADDALEKRDELGDKRFRLQGTVEQGSVDEVDGVVLFAVVFNGEEVSVAHEGSPEELFREGIPVVLEGHFEGAGEALVFKSDEMLVKHSEEYKAEDDYDERVDEADDGGSGGAAP